MEINQLILYLIIEFKNKLNLIPVHLVQEFQNFAYPKCYLIL